MKTRLSTFKIFLIVFIFQNYLHSQTEYFVTVDPVTGVHTRIDSLPGVKWIQTWPSTSAVDKVGNRYFFLGYDAANIKRLYTINCTNGAIISSPVFPPANSPFSIVGGFEFDPASGILYGLSYNQKYLISINPTAGTITNSVALPGIAGVFLGQNTYDAVGKRYFFTGQDAAQQAHFYTVNALTGSIISMPVFDPMQNNIVATRYNNATNKLYGFRLDTNNTRDLVEIDPATLNYTLTANLPWAMIVGGPNYTGIDEINNRYTFLNDNANNPNTLVSINLSTGTVVANPNFPVGLDSVQNVIELRYHNNNGVLYALHWGAANQTVTGVSPTGVTGINDYAFVQEDLFNLYPNPFSDKTTISLKDNTTEPSLTVTSCTGALIKKQKLTGVSSTELKKTDFEPGIYFVEIKTDAGRQIKKMVVE